MDASAGSARTTAAAGVGAPRVDVYAACWNDARMLPFFLRHYRPFARRIVVYDDGSTDGSVEYLRQAGGVEVCRIERRAGGSVVENLRALHDECWKQSRGSADWVIVVAVDEHVYHRRLLQYLALCRAGGVTIVPALGYEMVAGTFPAANRRLSDTVRRGVRFGDQHKACLFDPDAIDEIRFAPGRHRAAPTGRVRYPDLDELRLLHYKHLGLGYVLARTAELRGGLGAADVSRGYAWQWRQERGALARRWLGLLLSARSAVVTRPWSVAGWSHRWWRPQGTRQETLREQCRYLRTWWSGRGRVHVTETGSC